MSYIGDMKVGQVFDFKFTSRGTTGAPTQLAGSPVIKAYKSNSTTTEVTTGITLTVDFDSITGLNHVRVDTSDAFYATGNDFSLVITTGTVGGTSVVGEVVGEFSIENRTPLRPTVAGRTLDVNAAGEAGVDWSNVGAPTTVLALTGTTIKTATDVETDTADIQTRLPAALVSGRIDASVGAMASNVITAAALAADAGAELADAVWDEDIVAAHTTADTAGRCLKTLDAISDRTNNANLNALLGVADTASNDLGEEIADEVWDEPTSGHVTAGTFGEQCKSDIDSIVADVADLTTNGVNVSQISGDSVAADTLEAWLDSMRAGTAQAGAAGTITLDAGASATDDFYNDALVVLTGSTGAGQARLISDYVGSTKVASVIPNWATNPSGTTTFLVIPQGRVDVGRWMDSAPNALVAGRVDADMGALSTDATAADNLEAMLDGTGGVDFTFRKIIGVATANDHCVSLTGSGTGDGLFAQGGATGNGIRGRGGATSGHGLNGTAQNNGNGLFALGAGVGFQDIEGDISGDLEGSVQNVTGNVSGNVTGSVGSVAAGGITAASIATGAIDADAIADNAIDAGAIAADAITAAKIANGAIDAATFAAGAIDAAAIAADAGTEISAAVWAKVVETAGSYTAQQAMSVLLAALAGVTSGSGATAKTPNGATVRAVWTYDASQNRLSATLTPSA